MVHILEPERTAPDAGFKSTVTTRPVPVVTWHVIHDHHHLTGVKTKCSQPQSKHRQLAGRCHDTKSIKNSSVSNTYAVRVTCSAHCAAPLLPQASPMPHKLHTVSEAVLPQSTVRDNQEIAVQSSSARLVLNQVCKRGSHKQHCPCSHLKTCQPQHDAYHPRYA